MLRVGGIADRLMKLVAKIPARPQESRTAHPKRLSENEIDQQVAAFTSGVTVKVLSKHYGIHRTTAMDHPRRRKILRKGEWSNAAVKKAAMRYEAGETLDEIAATMSVVPRMVGRQLRLAGVDTRPSGPRRKVN